MTAVASRIEVNDPQAYQKKLIGLTGGRDPLAILSATPQTLRGMVREVPAEIWKRRPFPGKWTPNEVLGHLLDAEWVFGYRSRTILCDDRPQIIPMDQERWVAIQRHQEREPAELVEAFAMLRQVNLMVWRQLKPADLQRVGLHAERGEETLGMMLQMEAGHDLSHIDQIKRYLAAAQDSK